MFNLKKYGFSKENIVSYGNMFLLGNGHLGYRGTLEEFTSNELVGLNVVGLYDRYQDKWRESINMPNPFYLKIENNDILHDKIYYHEINLDIKNAIFKRKTEFSDLTISSERFISQTIENCLCFKYQIKPKKDLELNITLGTDLNIYEINGPHFKKKDITFDNNSILFVGLTNENKIVYQKSKYIFPKNSILLDFNNGLYSLKLKVTKDKTYTFYCYTRINENSDFELDNFNITIYNNIKKEHKKAFINKWRDSDVIIKGNKEAQFAIRYSIYHLLILGNENYQTSIPARGVSGQTYKGAIFWDSEIFLLPFYTLNNPKVARQLLMYRINTLKGALEKAKEEGYEGAFYAWESQEFGQEGCSKYNVSDPITNEPVRTYFGEKQIHISADIAYGLLKYVEISGDTSILFEGGFNMILEIIKFYKSYSTYRNGMYHLDDVIGPDEYHERVNDNAFTNYIVKYICKKCMEISREFKFDIKQDIILEINNFYENLYLPLPDENKLIEQFENYYSLEDVYVDEVRKRIRHPQEYWGTKNGVAFKTRVIKQADVVTLLALFSDLFNIDLLKANFDFYYPYTEHGSSLSASMYSIIASYIGKTELSNVKVIDGNDDLKVSIRGSIDKRNGYNNTSHFVDNVTIDGLKIKDYVLDENYSYLETYMTNNLVIKNTFNKIRGATINYHNSADYGSNYLIETV